MPTRQDVQSEISSRLNTFYNQQIAPRQWRFFRVRYAEWLNGDIPRPYFAELTWSHTLTPDNLTLTPTVAETLIDRHLATKTDTNYSWNTVFRISGLSEINLSSVAIAMNLRVDSVIAPNSKGFITVARVGVNGNEYEITRTLTLPNRNAEAFVNASTIAEAVVLVDIDTSGWSRVESA